MSCRQGVSKVLLAITAVYLLLYIDRPLLPDKYRLPVIAQIDALRANLLELADPLLAYVGLDAATRGGEDYTPPSKFKDIPQLSNDADLEEALKKHEMIFLMAHAPWCGHCKNMHGEMAKLYDEIRHDFINFPEGKMAVYTYNAAADCKDQSCKIESLAQHIRGFPTLILVESDEAGKPVVQKYERARSSKMMAEFLLDQIMEPIMGSDAQQAQRYLGEYKEGIVHYVPQSMSIEQARKKSSGFSMRQQIFTRDFDVVKHFDRYNKAMKEDKHVMIAFRSSNYIGMIPNDAEASVPVIVSMLVNNAMGKFSDQKFLSSQLPRFLLLTRLRSTKFERSILEDFLSQTFIKPQILGQAVIVLLDETEDNDRVAFMVGMSNGQQDCMTLFDQMTSRRWGICVENVAEWKSHDEFANYWLSAIKGNLPESNDANYKADSAKKAIGSAATVLSKMNVDEFLTDNKEALVFTFSVAKHKDTNVKKFNSMTFDQIPRAIVDMTFDQGLKTDLVDAKVEDKETILHFVDQKLVGTYDGEIDQTKIANFLKGTKSAATEQVSGADL